MSCVCITSRTRCLYWVHINMRNEHRSLSVSSNTPSMAQPATLQEHAHLHSIFILIRFQLFCARQFRARLGEKCFNLFFRQNFQHFKYEIGYRPCTRRRLLEKRYNVCRCKAARACSRLFAPLCLSHCRLTSCVSNEQRNNVANGFRSTEHRPVAH